MSDPPATIRNVQWVADFVYPEPCLGCRRPVRAGICWECIGLLARPPPPVCQLCGAPTVAEVRECRECRGKGFAFDRARQVFVYGSTIRKAIHDLKYRAHRSLAEVLALPLVDAAADCGGMAVTWVPSSSRRLRERGFDHARLLAEAMADRLGIPCARLVVKVRDTPPQVSLEPSVRRRALEGAFASRLDPPREVIVVDDVFTTGATASEAARALKAGGAMRVNALSLARSLSASRRPDL